MRLETFRVKNFRSIVDSGPIEVANLTALLGRNESGKSNILRGLESLNSSNGFGKMRPIKDFPRNRRLGECTDDPELVWTLWSLDGSDQEELTALFPRAVGVTHVSIERPYGATHIVDFKALQSIYFEEKDVKTKIRKITPAVKAIAESLDTEPKAALELAADAFENGMSFESNMAK